MSKAKPSRSAQEAAMAEINGVCDVFFIRNQNTTFVGHLLLVKKSK